MWPAARVGPLSVDATREFKRELGTIFALTLRSERREFAPCTIGFPAHSMGLFKSVITGDFKLRRAIPSNCGGTLSSETGAIHELLAEFGFAK